MQLNFLSASNGLSLSKTFSKDSSKPYPLVKEVSSHHFSIKTIEDLTELIKEESTKGHCLLKGSLKKN